MIKITFPYNDQLTQFPFYWATPIRFPFYVNEISYLWEVGCGENGNIVLYISNGTTCSSKKIQIEESNIETYLLNGIADTSKYVLVELAKIGFGHEKICDLDPFAFMDIDDLTLGLIASAFADWITLDGAIVQVGSAVAVGADEGILALLNTTAIATGNIDLDGVNGYLGISGLESSRYISIYELDSRFLKDIDSMISVFRQLENIPASLIKEICIMHDVNIENNMLSMSSNSKINASNITHLLNQNNSHVYKDVCVKVDSAAHHLCCDVVHIGIIVDVEDGSTDTE